MGTFGRSWVLIKASIGVVRKDPELMAYPAISATLFILLFLMLMGIFFFTSFIFDTVLMVVLFVFLTFVGNFLMVFANVALVGAATIRLGGGDPTLADGFRIAGQNLGSIFKWAVISTFVSLILRALRERGGIFGAIASALMGMAWNLVTFFIIPVMIYEKQGMWASIKSSARVFKNNWGETLVGGFGLGIIFMLLSLVGVAIIILAVLFFFTLEAILIAFVIAVIYWAILAMFFYAVDAVFVAALYRYATTGKLGPDFQHVSHYIPRPHGYSGH